MSLPLSASAAATRIAAQWVVDALAGDEGVDFSVVKALVGALPECLTGAPEATRERLALRCLQEVASGGDVAATAAGARRVEAARSCEDLLLELVKEAGSSGILNKDMLPPFSEDIRNIIFMKKATLPETSIELLKEVDPEIASMVPPSQLERNSTNQHDNDQPLCSSHDHVNKDNIEFQQETSANLVNETEPRYLEKDPISPTLVLRQPCTSDRVSCDQQQDNNAVAVGLGARPPDKSPAVDENVPLGTVYASAGCDATFQGSTTEPLLKNDTEVPAMVQPQSPRQQYRTVPPHCIDAERLHDVGARDQSLKPIHEGLDPHAHAAVTPTFDRSSDALPRNVSDHGLLPDPVTPEDTTMVSRPHSSKTDTNNLQHESGEKVNQVLDDVSASIQPVEKDHVYEELTPQAASDLPSVSCNDAIQGGQSLTNHLPENATEHATVFEKLDGYVSHIELGCADKDNEALHDGASIVEKNTVHGGLNLQVAPLSQNCNSALHDKVSEDNCSYMKNMVKSRTDAQRNKFSISVPNITQDGTGTSTTNTSNKANLGNTSAGIPHGSSSNDFLHVIAAASLLSMTNKMQLWPNDQEINDSLEGPSQQDLCMKCGKAGQLIKCSGCLLAAHNRCFGSSVTFQGSNPFYCPLCFYTRATEAYQKARVTYCEARKNLATFLGTTQVVGQHDELLTGVLPGASNRAGQSNVFDSSKRKNIHQNEATNLAHRDEEPDQQRKKQKIYATDKGSPKEIVTEKASFVQNSDKHDVLKDNSSNKVQDVERQQKGVDKEADNGISSHETRRSSRKRCGSANLESEADKEDGPTKSHQSNDSDEIEATSSNDSGKRSSPPWRKMKHRKSRLLEKETVVSSNSRKIVVQQDQHTSSPSRKRNYAPHKRYSNPVAPTGRRSKLCWTEEEETTLKEAMAKFAPRDDGPIPWVQILEYGRDVFHRTRLPSDLRVKWRNITKKAGS